MFTQVRVLLYPLAEICISGGVMLFDLVGRIKLLKGDILTRRYRKNRRL